MEGRWCAAVNFDSMTVDRYFRSWVIDEGKANLVNDPRGLKTRDNRDLERNRWKASGLHELGFLVFCKASLSRRIIFPYISNSHWEIGQARSQPEPLSPPRRPS
ncbi:hypothetical protein Pint_03648 [Pistacia integerrima]|uniref:Uncharacterized protein n=1 Tax=Pistacia integerrima TaxID=434235 RepID=A0ACC0Z6V3_9ROSI|nr:hypothetical protein Pint_03648 [Pistacia integerrima]